MRVALASAIIAAMVAGCALFGSQPNAGSQPVRWTRSQQPIEPEALRPSDRPARNDLIVLLPKPNGKIGGVVVRTEGGKELLLDQAYAGAHIDGPGEMQPVTYDAEQARSEFSSVVAALPGRPATFLLYFLEGIDTLSTASDHSSVRDI